MALTHSSATEYALENQRVGGLQIRVAVICGLIQMCDGYDVGTIGWSVPSLTHEKTIGPSAFSSAIFSVSRAPASQSAALQDSTPPAPASSSAIT